MRSQPVYLVSAYENPTLVNVHKLGRLVADYSLSKLFAKAELLDEVQIRFTVLFGQVFQQALTLADGLQ